MHSNVMCAAQKLMRYKIQNQHPARFKCSVELIENSFFIIDSQMIEGVYRSYDIVAC